MSKKILAIFMVLAMVLCYTPMTAFGSGDGDPVPISTPIESAFKDMPTEGSWSRAALDKAVANGLLEGFVEKSGTYIKPSNPLTRAQMATIVNRAFGAEGKAVLTGVGDVRAGLWYTEEMQKAVKMGTMKLDSKMRPNDTITRQEAFTVLARAFKMTDGTAANLAQFEDGSEVASWAIESLGALVKAGYVQGSDNKLEPLAKMTRAQFAVVMDNMIKNYINKAGTVTDVAKGNVMINVPDVILEGLTITGDLIIGDGVGDGNVNLENVIVKGNLIARGGGVDSIVISGGSVEGKVIIAKVDGQIRVFAENGAEIAVVVIDDGKDDIIVEGTFGTLEVAVPDAPVILQNATIEKIEVKAEGVNLNVDKDSNVKNVEISAPNAEVKGEGKVNNVTAKEGGDNAKIETPNTKVENKGAEGVTAGGGTEVPEGSSMTNSSDGGGAVVTPPASSGGSSGGGGTSTPSVDPQAAEKAEAKAAIKPGWEILSVETAKNVLAPESLPEGVDSSAEYKATIKTSFDTKASAQDSGRTVTTLFTVPSGATVWYPVWAEGELTYESATNKEVAFGMVGHPLSADNIDANGVIYVARSSSSGAEFKFSIKLVDAEWNDVVYGAEEFTLKLSEYEFEIDADEVSPVAGSLEDGYYKASWTAPAGLIPLKVNLVAKTVNDLGYGKVIGVPAPVVSGPSGGNLQAWFKEEHSGKWYEAVYTGLGTMDLAYNKADGPYPDNPLSFYIFADTAGEYTITFKAVDTVTGNDIASDSVTITVIAPV